MYGVNEKIEITNDLKGYVTGQKKSKVNKHQMSSSDNKMNVTEQKELARKPREPLTAEKKAAMAAKRAATLAAKPKVDEPKVR